MYYFSVSEISFALCLDDVFRYVESDSFVDRPSLFIIEFCLTPYIADFVAEKSCSACVGMRYQRLFHCKGKVQCGSEERCEPFLDFFGLRYWTGKS
jgi:hypothetical protein